MAIKVGIMGYGTIGKRVADAVLLQPDMELTGVMAHSYNTRIAIAAERKLPIYAQTKETKQVLKEKGIEVSGMTEDLLDAAEVMVDGAPKPYGEANLEKLYRPSKVKAILQGGERHEAVQASFNAQANYGDAVGKDAVRVVSCNTTGLSRSLNALDRCFKAEKASVTLIRRAVDPSNVKKGPLNSIVPALKLPSHHGPDVETVLPHLSVFSTAVIVPTTLMHVHALQVRLGKEASAEEVLGCLQKTTRVRIIDSSMGNGSTAELMEWAKDLGHARGDMMDLAIWDKGIAVKGQDAYLLQAVHQESIVVPENIDAIRAVMGEKDAMKSIKLTNSTLGMHNPERFDH